MYLIRPGWKTKRMGITPWEKVNGNDVLKIIEEEGRLCYKSENLITDESANKFVKNRINQEHIAILDGIHITSHYICNRGISHEWIRHKLTEIVPAGCVKIIDDFTPMHVLMESMRYVNYMKRNNVTFIIPPQVNIPEGQYNNPDDYLDLTITERKWFENCLQSEQSYIFLVKNGWTPEQARDVLSIGVKTEFIVTCSITEWRHVMKQRTDKAAHPQMRELMRPQLEEFKLKLPILFDDITY